MGLFRLDGLLLDTLLTGLLIGLLTGLLIGLFLLTGLLDTLRLGLARYPSGDRGKYPLNPRGGLVRRRSISKCSLRDASRGTSSQRSDDRRFGDRRTSRGDPRLGWRENSRGSSRLPRFSSCCDSRGSSCRKMAGTLRGVSFFPAGAEFPLFLTVSFLGRFLTWNL